jgi:hypothetical protein
MVAPACLASLRNTWRKAHRVGMIRTGFWLKLLAQTEALNQRAVTIDVLAL